MSIMDSGHRGTARPQSGAIVVPTAQGPSKEMCWITPVLKFLSRNDTFIFYWSKQATQVDQCSPRCSWKKSGPPSWPWRSVETTPFYQALTASEDACVPHPLSHSVLANGLILPYLTAEKSYLMKFNFIEVYLTYSFFCSNTTLKSLSAERQVSWARCSQQ